MLARLLYFFTFVHDISFYFALSVKPRELILFSCSLSNVLFSQIDTSNGFARVNKNITYIFVYSIYILLCYLTYIVGQIVQMFVNFHVLAVAEFQIFPRKNTGNFSLPGRNLNHVEFSAWSFLRHIVSESLDVW